MKRIINQYFKFIFPALLLLLLGRETAIFLITPNEHHLQDASFFAPHLIENDEAKSSFSDGLAPYISNRKLVHNRYKTCFLTLSRYEIFDKEKASAQLQKCIEILDDALAAAPSTPLIWLEKAELYSRQQNGTDLMNQALLNAWHTGKRQKWVAHRRVNFSLENWQKLTAMNKANSEADFMRYSPNDNQLLRSLARYFLLNANAKPVIEAWIAKSEVKVQRRFIGYVRSGR